MIAAGRLRERVELQEPPAADDGAGGQTGGWTNVARLAAEVIALRGEEMTLAGAESGVTMFRVTLRRRTVGVGHRLLWPGWILDVRAVLPDPRREAVVLTCEGRPA